MVSIVELLILGIVIGIIVFVVKRRGKSIGTGPSSTGQIKNFKPQASELTSGEEIEETAVPSEPDPPA